MASAPRRNSLVRPMMRTANALPVMWGLALVLGCLLMIFAVEPARAEDSPPLLPELECDRGQLPVARAVFVEEGPEIDGQLDDAVWEKAEVITELTQVQPVFCVDPDFKTEIRILTDGESLFFSMRAYDPEPSKIVANRMARSEVFFYDDGFNMQLDTFNDRQNGFFFQVNPNGGRRDGTFARDNFEENWDGIWFASARIDSKGWVAEVEIPFKTLPFRPGADVWGLQLSRRVRRVNSELRWADPSLQRFGINMSRAGQLKGMSVAKQGLGLDVVPTFSFGATIDGQGQDNNPGPSPALAGGRDFDDHAELRIEPSFDAFYRVTPGLMASVTANTDFAQTEIDDAQINLTPFPIFFPEKREFFLRDTGIFQFADLSSENGIPFFSRRIGLSTGFDGKTDDVRLLGGARLTGRVGRFNLGFIDIQQDRNVQSEPPFILNRSFRRVGTPSNRHGENLAVARVSANVLEESNVGILLTHGDPESDRENLLAGADFNYRSSDLIKNRFVSANLWIQQNFAGGNYSDRSTAWGATLSYPNDIVNWKFRVKDIQNGFDPALGFVSRRDIRRYDGDFRYRIRPKSDVIRTWDVNFDTNLVTARDNHIEGGRFFFSPILITTQVDDSFELLFTYIYDDRVEPFRLQDHIYVPAREAHQFSGIIRIKTSQHRKIRFEYSTGVGEFYDGWGVRIAPLLEWRPNKHLLLSLRYDERRFNGLETCNLAAVVANTCLRASNEAKNRLFVVRLARVRVRVAFTPDISWNTVVQYDNVSEDLAFQTRLRWIIKPGREFFVVVGQDLDLKPGDFRVRETNPAAKARWTFRF